MMVREMPRQWNYFGRIGAALTKGECFGERVDKCVSKDRYWSKMRVSARGVKCICTILTRTSPADADGQCSSFACQGLEAGDDIEDLRGDAVLALELVACG